MSHALKIFPPDSLNAQTEHVLVFFHGYGANADDLYPLGAQADRYLGARGLSFVFPEGRISSAQGGRAWFEISEDRLRAMMLQGGPLRLASFELPADFDKAISYGKKLVEHLRSRVSAQATLTLGGFSQGAMLAMHIALLGIYKVDCAILFSPGAIGLESLIKPNVKNLPPAFVSHGKSDSILPFDETKELCDLFVSNNLDIEFCEFRGGHEIPFEAFSRALDFWKTRVLSK